MRHVFIGGAGRSGTTMLGALLAEAVGGIATPESHFKHEVSILGRDARAVWRSIEAHWRFQIWELEPGALPAGLDTGVDVLDWLVRRYAKVHGTVDPPWWVDHTPENVLHWDALFRLFPEAKGIHLVRDGRGVLASIRRLTWGPKTTLGAARYWRARVATGLAAETAHPGRVLRVRYEDLLTAPDATLETITSFLDAERASTEGGRFATPTYTQGQHELVGKPPDPRRATAWADTLSATDIERFEAIAGDLLDALGYPRRVPRPRAPGPVEDATSRAVELVQQHLILPLRRVPTRGAYVAAALARRFRKDAR